MHMMLSIGLHKENEKQNLFHCRGCINRQIMQFLYGLCHHDAILKGHSSEIVFRMGCVRVLQIHW